jgi:hypothetical protein
VATLKLERGGKRASLMNKFKVFIDGDHVGDLKKYGHSAEFEVQSGAHVVTVKAFGGVTGEAEIEFAEGETMDLMVGYPSFVLGVIQGVTAITGTLGFWERDS